MRTEVAIRKLLAPDTVGLRHRCAHLDREVRLLSGETEVAKVQISK